MYACICDNKEVGENVHKYDVESCTFSCTNTWLLGEDDSTSWIIFSAYLLTLNTLLGMCWWFTQPCFFIRRTFKANLFCQTYLMKYLHNSVCINQQSYPWDEKILTQTLDKIKQVHFQNSFHSFDFFCFLVDCFLIKLKHLKLKQ